MPISITTTIISIRFTGTSKGISRFKDSLSTQLHSLHKPPCGSGPTSYWIFQEKW